MTETPALLTRICAAPCSATTAAGNAAICSASATSTIWVETVAPRVPSSFAAEMEEDYVSHLYEAWTFTAAKCQAIEERARRAFSFS